DAENIGAVNTIKRLKDGRLIGYNTDFLGFRGTLLERFGSSMFRSFDENGALGAKMPTSHKALILGTGGASKAIVYALESLGVGCQYISRKRTKDTLTYDDLDEEHIKKVTIIVNCTPLGTFPEVHLYPDIPFTYLDSRHIVYDLIYNPSQSQFLAMAKAQNATTINGLRMLELQAEASWDIWNKP
ncbi:MAG: shikimate dehydrogenase, partial [Dokdonia sp.]